MKKDKIVASLMLSTTLMTVAVPVLADQAKPNSETTVESNTVNKNGVLSDKANDVKDTSVADSTTSSSSSSTEKSKNDPIQTIKEQKMIIKKIIAQGSSQMATISENNENGNEKSLGIAQSDYKGVPNSKFVIYDVTDLMDTIIKEKLGVSEEESQRALDAASSEEIQDVENSSTSSAQKATSESDSKLLKNSDPTEQTTSQKVSEESSSDNSSENASKVSKNAEVDQGLVQKVKNLRQGDTLRKTISERAAKLNQDQLKPVTEVTTDEQGIAEVTLPIDGKYHAYYVVNTETDKESYATNSSPIVVITPVSDSNGNYADEFTIYPKSDTIEKEQPTQETPQNETTATMYQTGHKNDSSLFAKIKKWISNFF